jgi:hypothetical protein
MSPVPYAQPPRDPQPPKLPQKTTYIVVETHREPPPPKERKSTKKHYEKRSTYHQRAEPASRFVEERVKYVSAAPRGARYYDSYGSGGHRTSGGGRDDSYYKRDDDEPRRGRAPTRPEASERERVPRVPTPPMPEHIRGSRFDPDGSRHSQTDYDETPICPITYPPVPRHWT